MDTYHKIQNVFKRDPHTNYKTLMEGEWSEPEFEYLKDNLWVGTEKIDGTNIRIIWDGSKVSFKGKTDKAQIPAMLMSYLKNKFTYNLMRSVFEDREVCLYGEGYGFKIQKVGGKYLPKENSFILFDVKAGKWWLKREAVEGIAVSLFTRAVPIIGEFTLLEAVEYVKKGFHSVISVDDDLMAEGLILKPKIELASRSGNRIITKIKHKDFAR